MIFEISREDRVTRVTPEVRVAQVAFKLSISAKYNKKNPRLPIFPFSNVDPFAPLAVCSE